MPDHHQTRLIFAAIAVVGVSLGAAALASDTLRGNANIVDGDTIEIAGVPVRLEGIDAPEQRQSCTSESGNVACGKLATKALARMIGSAPVTCVVHGKDRYDRLLGECSADGKSLNKAMVQDGWALAFVKYSDRYVSSNGRRKLTACETMTTRSGKMESRFSHTNTLIGQKTARRP